MTLGGRGSPASAMSAGSADRRQFNQRRFGKGVFSTAALRSLGVGASLQPMSGNNSSPIATLIRTRKLSTNL